VFAHGGGITIGDSDHMLATRLYQNNARVHFDDAYMQTQSMGKRLVYGGHIMSLCRALSYNGLENALWISAFHGGLHSNPSFAGDTIYSASVVLESTALKNNISAVRLCTFGLKQEADACLLGELPALALSQKMPDGIVLKWDYSVLMPS
jgi:2-methylfumaryl-CoA hydratase